MSADRLADYRAIVRALHGHRFTLSNEKTTQAEIAAVLVAAGLPAVREVRLGEAGIVDIAVNRTVVEVKLAGGKRAIHRQCARYCDHPDVDALILATSVAVTLPGIAKPTHVLSLGKAWL